MSTFGCRCVLIITLACQRTGVDLSVTRMRPRTDSVINLIRCWALSLKHAAKLDFQQLCHREEGLGGRKVMENLEVTGGASFHYSIEGT